MTVAFLYPAVALATMINVALFVVLWRGHKIEQHTGEPPWWMYVIIITYGLGATAFVYLKQGAALSSQLDLVLTAMLGQLMGVGGVYAVVNFFHLSRGFNRSARIIAFVQMTGFVGLCCLGLFM